MYNGRVTDNLLTKKMNAIISCYFLSPVLPLLQIDVTKEIAANVTKTVKLSSVVFKDAEVSEYACIKTLQLSIQEQL